MHRIQGLAEPHLTSDAAHMMREAARDATQVTYVFRAEDHRWDHQEIGRLSMRLGGVRVFPGEGQERPHVVAILGNYSTGQVATALGYKTFECTEVLQGLDNPNAPFPIDARVWPIELL